MKTPADLAREVTEKCNEHPGDTIAGEACQACIEAAISQERARHDDCVPLDQVERQIQAERAQADARVAAERERLCEFLLAYAEEKSGTHPANAGYIALHAAVTAIRARGDHIVGSVVTVGPLRFWPCVAGRHDDCAKRHDVECGCECHA